MSRCDSSDTRRGHSTRRATRKSQAIPAKAEQTRRGTSVAARRLPTHFVWTNMQGRVDMRMFWCVSALVVMAACTTSRSQDGPGEPSAKAEDSTVVPFDEPAPVARISTGTTDEDAALLTAAATGDPD